MDRPTIQIFAVDDPAGPYCLVAAPSMADAVRIAGFMRLASSRERNGVRGGEEISDSQIARAAEGLWVRPASAEECRRFHSREPEGAGPIVGFIH